MNLIKSSLTLVSILFLSVSGLVLSGCTAAQQAEFQTQAEAFGSNAKAYAQTLAVMIQKIAGVAQATAPTIETLAQQWACCRPTPSSSPPSTRS